MDEEWKDIIGYEGKYMISNLGRVKCVARIQKWGKGFRHVKECILTPRKTGGYMWRYKSEQPNLTKEKFRNSKYQIK